MAITIKLIMNSCEINYICKWQGKPINLFASHYKWILICFSRFFQGIG